MERLMIGHGFRQVSKSPTLTLVVSCFLMWFWFIIVIELSGAQFGLKSYACFQNWTSAQCEFDLKSQVWFQTKIAQHKVQLPLLFLIHLFWNHRVSLSVNINILFLLLHSHFDGLKKGCDLEQKMVQFGNKSHCWEPIRLQGSPVISKWV